MASNPNSVARLNAIETSWSLVDRAHRDVRHGDLADRHSLLDKYRRAAWRYLLASTRDASLAEELLQEFSLRLLRGDFRRATPQRGRFRDYIRVVLINLVNDHRRSRRDAPLPLSDGIQPAADLRHAAAADDDETFLTCWRAELLHRTWSRLGESSPDLFATLRTHVAAPNSPSQEKAERLSAQSGKRWSGNHFRVSLHRARGKFAALLVNEVSRSLEEPSPSNVREELRLLRLLKYCEAD